MEDAFLSGQDIYLRTLRTEDVDGCYSRWLNDHNITRYLESGFFPSTREHLLDYIIARQGSNDKLMLAIIEKDSNRHIGNVKLEPIRWIHRNADISILLGEKDCQGKGYATQALELMVTYAFNTLNLRKLNLGVIAENEAAVKLYRKLGFHVDGVLKEQGFYNGHYCDDLIMSLLRSEYRQKEDN